MTVNFWCTRTTNLPRLSAVLFYARTAKIVRTQICVGDMRVSRRQAKGRQRHLSHYKTLVRRLSGLPDLLRQPCREKRMRKRNMQYPPLYSQGSKFEFQTVTEKWGGGWAAPTAPRFRRPCSRCYGDPKVNTTMFRSILLNGVTTFACESHGVQRAKPICVCNYP